MEPNDKQSNRFDFSALPMKRMGAGAVFLNTDHELLIVKPTYREKWQLPGGIVEEHESPRAACVREVQEELGLSIDLEQLLCIEYRSTVPPKTESLQFVFYGGVLTTSQIQTIKLPPDEIKVYEFVSLNEAQNKLGALSAQRIQWAWKALHEQRTVYAEDGVAQL
jgi:8-oxo-dGTP pyrophosphatase MutT (NUDIX family)